MTIEFTLPEMNTKNKTAKDLIIAILLDEWPLSLKKIHNKIKKDYESNVTYQAVHKAVGELLEKRIVVRNGRDYKINSDWIGKLKLFIEKLENSYNENKPLSEEIPKSLTVSCAWELYEIFIEIILRDILDGKEKSICFIGNQIWNPMIGSEKEIEAYKKIAEKYKLYLVSRRDNEINRMWKTYWEKIGMRAKTKINIGFPDSVDVFLIGDFFIQIFYPEDLIDAENELDKIKKFSEVNAKDVNDLYFEKFGEIQIIINKNKEVADKLRKKVEELF